MTGAVAHAGREGPRTRCALLAAFLVAALAAGCGAGERREPAAPLTRADVTRVFEAEAGRQLRGTTVADPAWEQLGFGLDPPPEVRREYGVFSIYVVEPGNEDAVDSLLRDKATGKRLARDERGIYWERDSLSKTWIANTLYGSNVVLVWFSESPTRRTDRRWERLDAILSGLRRT